jgi:tetratricopeptide (TPR) repeat protein
LLVTSRTQPPEPFEALRLEPLSQEEAQSVLETEIEAELPHRASDWIHARAAGNPLFTLEFFRFLARAGHLWNDGKRWHWRAPANEVMPVTIEALIERLIDQAIHSNTVRDALEARALLPLGTSERLVADVSKLTLERLHEAEHELERGNVFSGGEFAHPLFKEVVSHNLSRERRQELARCALSALEDDPVLAAVFVEDARLEPAVALEWLERAAQRAKEQGNEVQAARLLAQAVEYASGEERGRLALDAARGVRSASILEATRLAEIAAGSSADTTEATLLWAELVAYQGRMNDVERILEALPSEARAIQWATRMLRVRILAGDYNGVLKLWQEVPALLSDNDPNNAYPISFALVSVGRHDEALAMASEALNQPGLTQTQQATLLTVCGGVYWFKADYPRAEALRARSLEIARAVGQPRNIAIGLFNHASTLMCLCQYVEARNEFQEALLLFDQVGNSKMYAHTQVLLGEIYTELGEYTQAEEVLLESRELLARLDASDALVDCESQLGCLYLEWQPPHGRVLAFRHAQAALRVARLQDNSRNIVGGLLPVSQAETWQGNPRAGLEIAEEALGLATNLGQPRSIGVAQYARGLALKALGVLDQARVAFEKAHDQASAVGLLQDTHKYGLELDRLTNNLESARAHLAWFEERELHNGANIARRYFPELASGNSTQNNTPESVTARLEVLGAMRIHRDGRFEVVRGQKRKALLALLLEARLSGRTEVPQFKLCEILYPESSPEEAATALKQLVSQLRSSLVQGAISTTSNGYALGAFDSDAEAFLKHGDPQLWRGAYLEDVSLESGDDTVREVLYHALCTKAEDLIPTDPKEAARLGRILLEAEPYDLGMLELCLKALRADGNHRTLSRLYKAAQARMLEVGERLPEDWRAFLESHAASLHL